jgi:hypothetical protein
MSFNSRYISETRIGEIVKEEDLEYLIQFIKKPDSLIIEDEFSEKICDIILNNDEKFVLTELLKMGLYGKKKG